MEIGKAVQTTLEYVRDFGELFIVGSLALIGLFLSLSLLVLDPGPRKKRRPTGHAHAGLPPGTSSGNGEATRE